MSRNIASLLSFQMANYEFFKELEERCCGKLKHYIFKVFEPKRKDSKATMLAEVVIKESKKEVQTAAESTVKIPEKKILGKILKWIV